jgi:hypothetical protein
LHLIRGVSIGEHPWVTHLFKGIASARPTRARYSQYWEIDPLLNEVKGWGPNVSLSMKQLTQKTIILLRVATLDRSSDIAYIKRSSITFHAEYMSVDYHSKKQQRRSDQSFRHVVARLADEVLCPVATTEHYMQRTAQFIRNSRDRLILSVDGSKPLGAERIAKLVLEVMKKAGVDTTIFKAGSLRGAAASQALDHGLPVEDVIRMGQWRSYSVFDRFYNRSRRVVPLLQRVLSTNQHNS